MAPGREVGSVAQNAVGPPRDEVGDAWHDVEAASGTDVRLHRLRLRNGLDIPLATVAHLSATPSNREALDVEVGVGLTSAGRASP